MGRLTYLVSLKCQRFNALSDIYQGKNSKSLPTTLYGANERADAHLFTQIFYVAKHYTCKDYSSSRGNPTEFLEKYFAFSKKNAGILMEQLQPLENDTNPIKIQGIKGSNHGRRPFFDLRNVLFP